MQFGNGIFLNQKLFNSMDLLSVLGEAQLTEEEKEVLKKKFRRIRRMLSFPDPTPPPSTALAVEERCKKLKEVLLSQQVMTRQSPPPELSEKNRSRILADKRAGKDQW